MNEHDFQKLVANMSLPDIWHDIDAIISSGVSINYVLNLGEPYPHYFSEHFEELLSLGADPLWLFRYNEEWYKAHTDYVKKLAEIFRVYDVYGLGANFIKNWLLSYVRVDDIAANAKYLEPFGITCPTEQLKD